MIIMIQNSLLVSKKKAPQKYPYFFFGMVVLKIGSFSCLLKLFYSLIKAS